MSWASVGRQPHDGCAWRAWGVSPMMVRRIMGLTPHARQSAHRFVLALSIPRSINMRLHLAGSLALCLLASAVWAGDFEKDRLDNWHHWRGPLATGVAPHGNPPTRWDEKTNIKWKAELPGKGSASPI